LLRPLALPAGAVFGAAAFLCYLFVMPLGKATP